MYDASQAFHDAVRNGNHQMPLLIFDDAVFTERDIDVNEGIEFDDNFNMEEDLAIGQATSNEIRFTLLNDDRLLNNYAFGEFQALLGVMTGTHPYTLSGPATMITDFATYTTGVSTPYLRRDGVSLGVNFRVQSLLGYGSLVWAFGANGNYAVFVDYTGENVTSSHPMNGFMLNKVKTWKGVGYFMRDRYLTIFSGGVAKDYEFVPLGTFIAERPNAPDQISISMTCYDRMTLFDEDIPEDIGITYPTTIGELFAALANYAGVPYQTGPFINSTATIQKRPDDFDNVTMRTVLMWIAEAAGCNARFNRDGVLVLDWLKSTDQSYSESDYIEFTPYWYETERIGKLYSRETSSGTDVTVGEGVGYLIQDNPLLKDAT